MVERKKKEEAILKYAKEEFLENGFRAASLRSIAKHAGTTTGSIYSHFYSKHELFQTLVEEHATKIKQIVLDSLEIMTACGGDEPLYELYYHRVAQQFFDYIYEKRDEMRLLINCAAGTEYENFIEDLSEIELVYYNILWPPILRERLYADILLRIMSRNYYYVFFSAGVLWSGRESNLLADQLLDFHIAGCKAVILAEII